MDPTSQPSLRKMLLSLLLSLLQNMAYRILCYQPRTWHMFVE